MWAPNGLLQGLNESKLALMHTTATQLAITRGHRQIPTLGVFYERVMRVVLAFQNSRGCSAVEVELWDGTDGRLVLEPVAAGITVITARDDELGALVGGVVRP